MDALDLLVKKLSELSSREQLYLVIEEFDSSSHPYGCSGKIICLEEMYEHENIVAEVARVSPPGLELKRQYFLSEIVASIDRERETYRVNGCSGAVVVQAKIEKEKDVTIVAGPILGENTLHK
jgi:hypothetical protein